MMTFQGEIAMQSGVPLKLKLTLPQRLFDPSQLTSASETPQTIRDEKS